MKILTLGDTHGRPYWKDIIDKNEFDIVVFLGDYVDSYEIDDANTIKNLLDIIEYKKSNMDSCVLLLGNHDIQYLFSHSTHGCSGYRPQMYVQLHQIFNDNKDLFQVAFQIDNYLWTHAGVSNAWYKKFFEVMPTDLENSFADRINQVFNSSNEWIISQVGQSRGGLRGDYGGPLWADASETQYSPLPGCHQIVGHTPQRKINTFEGVEKTWSYTYCDVLQHTKEGYILELYGKEKEI